MRVLIVTNHYWPEDFSDGVYVRELAEALVQSGHSVTVLTNFPNYPEGRIHDGYRGKAFQVEWKAGVRIVRSYVYPVDRRRPLIQRAFGQVSFSLSAIAAAPFTGEADVVYVVTPPPSLVAAAWFASKLNGARLVVGVKDILTAWEQVKKAGNDRVVRLAARLEPPAFAAADHIQVAAEAHARFVHGMGIPEDRITMIPDWADGGAICPQPRENAFRAEHGLQGKFVLLYSGSLGYSSALET